jgi:REP element-mobilizing transposase RayT
MKNKGIYDRGYLPHWDFPRALQAVTFRLADSVPAKVITERIKELETATDEKERQRQLHRMIAHYEDAGHGAAILHDESCAMIVQEELRRNNGTIYQLHDWCVMPNHVHVLMMLFENHTLAEVVRQWKGATALKLNRLREKSGRLWQPDYYDRYVRDMNHFYNCRIYIRNNPVKAGLCAKPKDWPYSSASWMERGL